MKIEVLYPEVANLYGELGNIMYLRASLEQSGIPCEITETPLTERPAFLDPEKGIEFVYLGTVTEHSQELILEKFKGFREDFEAAVERGTHILITGNSLEIFGSGVKDKDGSGFKGLGMFPFRTERNMMHHYNAFCVDRYFPPEGSTGRTKLLAEKPVVGFKCQFTQSYYEEEPEASEKFSPLFVAERGPGFNPDVTSEGIRYNNLMLTYMIGPIFVLSPYFMLSLLSEMKYEDAKPAYEKSAEEAYVRRLKEFRDPNRDFIY
ncbi:MAG: hypothetical protein PUC44_06700 [Eubacteriales bacterium]|nr:hypothetical protein [Eubacteriales bacterium]